MNGLGGVEREYIRRYHKHEPAENQCSSALIKHIKAPVHLALAYYSQKSFFLLGSNSSVFMFVALVR